MKLGHVHLKVRSLAQAEAFYTKLLGLQVTERVGDRFAFLSFGEAHHDLALQELGDGAAAPPARSIGLYHVAFEVPDASSLLRAVDALQRMDAPAAAVDHLISWALYTQDPDGNGVEIYLDRRQSAGGSAHWSGTSLPLTRGQIEDAAADGRS